MTRIFDFSAVSQNAYRVPDRATEPQAAVLSDFARALTDAERAMRDVLYGQRLSLHLAASLRQALHLASNCLDAAANDGFIAPRHAQRGNR
jgi:hypothetical protein